MNFPSHNEYEENEDEENEDEENEDEEYEDDEEYEENNGYNGYDMNNNFILPSLNAVPNSQLPSLNWNTNSQLPSLDAVPNSQLSSLNWNTNSQLPSLSQPLQPLQPAQSLQPVVSTSSGLTPSYDPNLYRQSFPPSEPYRQSFPPSEPYRQSFPPSEPYRQPLSAPTLHPIQEPLTTKTLNLDDVSSDLIASASAMPSLWIPSSSEQSTFDLPILTEDMFRLQDEEEESREYFSVIKPNSYLHNDFPQALGFAEPALAYDVIKPHEDLVEYSSVSHFAYSYQLANAVQRKEVASKDEAYKVKNEASKEVIIEKDQNGEERMYSKDAEKVVVEALKKALPAMITRRITIDDIETNLEEFLLSTGQAEIIYINSKDKFLGTNERGNGSNVYGRMLMNYRDSLLEKSEKSSSLNIREETEKKFEELEDIFVDFHKQILEYETSLESKTEERSEERMRSLVSSHDDFKNRLQTLYSETVHMGLKNFLRCIFNNENRRKTPDDILEMKREGYFVETFYTAKNSFERLVIEAYQAFSFIKHDGSGNIIYNQPFYTTAKIKEEEIDSDIRKGRYFPSYNVFNNLLKEINNYVLESIERWREEMLERSRYGLQPIPEGGEGGENGLQPIPENDESGETKQIEDNVSKQTKEDEEDKRFEVSAEEEKSTVNKDDEKRIVVQERNEIPSVDTILYNLRRTSFLSLVFEFLNTDTEKDMHVCMYAEYYLDMMSALNNYEFGKLRQGNVFTYLANKEDHSIEVFTDIAFLSVYDYYDPKFVFSEDYKENFLRTLNNIDQARFDLLYKEMNEILEENMVIDSSIVSQRNRSLEAILGDAVQMKKFSPTSSKSDEEEEKSDDEEEKEEDEEKEKEEQDKDNYIKACSYFFEWRNFGEKFCEKKLVEYHKMYSESYKNYYRNCFNPSLGIDKCIDLLHHHYVVKNPSSMSRNIREEDIVQKENTLQKYESFSDWFNDLFVNKGVLNLGLLCRVSLRNRNMFRIRHLVMFPLSEKLNHIMRSVKIARTKVKTNIHKYKPMYVKLYQNDLNFREFLEEDNFGWLQRLFNQKRKEERMVNKYLLKKGYVNKPDLKDRTAEWKEKYLSQEWKENYIYDDDEKMFISTDLLKITKSHLKARIASALLVNIEEGLYANEMELVGVDRSIPFLNVCYFTEKERKRLKQNTEPVIQLTDNPSNNYFPLSIQFMSEPFDIEPLQPILSFSKEQEQIAKEVDANNFSKKYPSFYHYIIERVLTSNKISYKAFDHDVDRFFGDEEKEEENNILKRVLVHNRNCMGSYFVLLSKPDKFNLYNIKHLAELRKLTVKDFVKPEELEKLYKAQYRENVRSVLWNGFVKGMNRRFGLDALKVRGWSPSKESLYNLRDGYEYFISNVVSFRTKEDKSIKSEKNLLSFKYRTYEEDILLDLYQQDTVSDVERYYETVSDQNRIELFLSKRTMRYLYILRDKLKKAVEEELKKENTLRVVDFPLTIDYNPEPPISAQVDSSPFNHFIEERLTDLITTVISVAAFARVRIIPSDQSNRITRRMIFRVIDYLYPFCGTNKSYSTYTTDFTTLSDVTLTKIFNSNEIKMDFDYASDSIYKGVAGGSYELGNRVIFDLSRSKTTTDSIRPIRIGTKGQSLDSELQESGEHINVIGESSVDLDKGIIKSESEAKSECVGAYWDYISGLIVNMKNYETSDNRRMPEYSTSTYDSMMEAQNFVNEALYVCRLNVFETILRSIEDSRTKIFTLLSGFRRIFELLSGYRTQFIIDKEVVVVASSILLSIPYSTEKKIFEGELLYANESELVEKEGITYLLEDESLFKYYLEIANTMIAVTFTDQTLEGKLWLLFAVSKLFYLQHLNIPDEDQIPVEMRQGIELQARINASFTSVWSKIFCM